MKLNTEPIKNWFGFTRRERRSTFSLLVIIVVILVLRYAIPNSNVTVENLTEKVSESANDNGSATNDRMKPDSVKFRKAFSKKTSAKSNKKFSASNVNYIVYQADRKSLRKPVDLNQSDTSALVKLPGIGPVLSLRIIKYRNFLGGFARVEQLKEVYGLPEETYEMIKNRVTVDSSFIKRIDINSADYKELSRIRYLDKYEIASILKYRQLKGRIAKISDLIDNKLITQEKAKKLGAYIRFE